MAHIDTLLAGNRAAVDEFATAVDRCATCWTTPRAPGKWSPSQVVEHVARALDESANVVAGLPSKFPNLPGFLQPIVRALLFKRVLKNGTFPRARTNRALNPDAGPATPGDGRDRVLTANARFEQECRTRFAAGERVNSTTFGKVSVEDYVRFAELHTRHHRRQIPG